MVYDVDIVAVPEQAVVVLPCGSPEDLDRCETRLRGVVAQAGLTPAGPLIVRLHEDESGQKDPTCDVALAVTPRDDGSVPDTVGEAHGEWIPLHHVLEAVHIGPRETIGDARRAVREAAGALGYTQAGPLTEVLERVRTSGSSPEDRDVTRVRLPYAR